MDIIGGERHDPSTSGYASKLSKADLNLCRWLTCCLLGFAASAEAQPPDERWTFAVGAYDVVRYDSTALLTSSDADVGLALVPENILGLDSRRTVLRLEGSYAFNNRHSLVFSWHQITSKSGLSIKDEIDWIDENGDPITIPIGADVSSRLDYDIAKLGYRFTFYNSDKVSLSAGAGLHMTSVELILTAESTSSGVSASRGETSLPLPVLAFGLDYTVTPKFSWFLQAELFALSFDDWTGTYDDILFGAEYRLFKKISVGAALGNNALRAVEQTGDVRFEFENRITGLFLYLKGHL